MNACELRQKAKRDEKVDHGLYLPVMASEPKELIPVDIYGPLPPSSHGYRYVVVIIDAFTKLVKLYPVTQQTASNVVKAVKKYLAEVKKVKDVIIDNGRQFHTNEWCDFWKGLGTEVKHTRPRNPKANGNVERVMITLGDCVRLNTYENHKEWAKWLPDIETRTNSMVHSTTNQTLEDLQPVRYTRGSIC